MMKDMWERRWYKFCIGLGVAAIFASPFLARAASLDFSPAIKTVSVGETFTVAVTVSSPDQAMNAASGDVSFPSDKLRALSVSNGGSAMNLWVQSPSFSNAAGNINFAGVVLNPGYIGTAGKVITIWFQAIATGNAPVSFSDGSILANDGKGTNILTSLGSAEFTITPAVPGTTSSVPVIISSGTPSTTVATATVATTTVPGSQSVFVNNGIPWELLIFLVALLMILIFALFYSLNRRRVHLSDHDFLHKRKELRDDLRRIEKELEADRSGSTIDLSAPGIHKKKDNIKHEIEHLEEDIKRDMKDTD